MRFLLKDFQVDAVDRVLDAMQEGTRRFTRSSKLTAISLSAPTGAGKTVIATALLERMLFGDESTPPAPQTTVLWVTDDPSLNQQTRRKMLLASSQLSPSQLVAVDATFVQRSFSPGHVYFVHIQQLGKGATKYIETGNHRSVSLWDTIANTVRERPEEFLLIVDEAHKGTSVRKDGGRTITARLMDGSVGNLPPTPLVLGISATPERFVDAVGKIGQRVLEPVGVDPEEVRDSGLIKDKIRIRHPADSQPSDSTLLELAVRDLRTMDSLWTAYTSEAEEPPVRPVLVVQVKAGVSDAELKETLETLKRAWDVLDDRAIAHAFQSHTPLTLGTKTVRYVSPPNVQEDPHLRVVLFKEALTTGWDCPRAEVMVSFRTAKEHTYIAQLIGRMVRTPLARKVSTNDVLNTVALYLPFYDDVQVTAVVAGIQSDEGQIASQLEVDAVTCSRNPDVPAEVWQMLADLPTYTRPAKIHRNEVARLNALATLLQGDSLQVQATQTARKHVEDTLDREAKRLGVTLSERVKEFENVIYQDQSLDLFTGDVEKETGMVPVNSHNILDLFRRARKILGDAAAQWYWDRLCEEGQHPDVARIMVAALAADPSVPVALESAAKTLIDSWRSTHNAAINQLSDEHRSSYYEIWQQSRDPQQVTLIMPDQITAPGKAERRKLHVYADLKKEFPATFTGWEAAVLKRELKEGGSLRAWYRNPSAGTRALGVPYTESGVKRTMYPDFLFFHELAKGRLAVDIIDPHRPDHYDTGPKWHGLWAYAVKHGANFRRIEAVIGGPNDSLLSLDLKNPALGQRLETARTEVDIRALFRDFGGVY